MTGPRLTSLEAPIRAPSEGSETFAGDPDFMASLARGLTVIRAFSGGTGTRTIGSIARSTGMSRAAARRCLYTLRCLGYVASDAAGHYTLQPRVLALGYAFLTSSSLAVSAAPVLDRASALLSESCSLATLDADAIIYVARSSVSTRLMSIDLGVGSRLPASCTSMGRVLLAALDEPELDAWLARQLFVAHTPRTLTDPRQVRHAIVAAREDGHAVVDQELEQGLRSMAVPVRDPAGRVVAALNVSTHAARVTIDDLRLRCLPVLLSAAQELSMLVRA